MALEGSLQDMSLVDLIQVFRMGPKTGVLLLTRGDERGVVYVSAGRMVDALLVRGAGRAVVATDEEAVIRLLQWEDASFIFRHDPAAAGRPPRIAHDGEWLVMEGMRRRADPRQVLPHRRITPESRLELAALPSGAESGVKLDLDQWRIMSQVPVCRDVREIAERTGADLDAVIRIVAELVAIGLVDVGAPPAPPRPRREAPAQSYGASLRPAAAGVGVPGLEGGAAPGSGLLQAIMRRVRGL